MIERFFTLDKPRFHIKIGDASSFADLYLRLANARPTAAVRLIRGRKSRTVSAFFDEISAALQFPYYFGENWNAFAECVADLDWIDADAFVLMFADAHLVLADEAEEEFATLLRILANAGEEWLEPNRHMPRERPATPFHAVFHCPPEHKEPFVARVARAGEDFDVIEGE